MYKILQTPKFKKWYFKQDLKIKTIISSRLKRVKDSGELGDIKYLGNKLFEFRWRVGIRVYFTVENKKIILILSGGNKNGQKKYIEKAKELRKSYIF